MNDIGTLRVFLFPHAVVDCADVDVVVVVVVVDVAVGKTK